jgi:bifunctional pyridoxal-dependent enzyme with beta-cystathionase and maltose regulon repressor activities
MREAIHNLEASKIREVANAGLGRDDVLAFWFGESDEVTPEVIRQAAIDSLQRGETFYAHNLGLPELREAIAGYTSRLHPAVDASRIAVTSGGVSALMLAVQALVDAGDEVVAVTPVWPNLTAQPAIMGAQVRTVSLVKPADGQWTLDLAALLKSHHAEDETADRQCAQQPDRLDHDARRAAGHAGRTAAKPAPGSWPTRCTSGCITSPRPMAARRASSTSPGPTTGW